MNKETVSVVLSAYNGSKFIEQQLDSIRFQSLYADEVLIVDDCSTDNTYGIISDYINKNALSNWKLNKNQSNYGWKKSFAKALPMAKGDYVFPADQDDIWKTDKLETMVREMKNNPDCLLLASATKEIYFDENPEINNYFIKEFYTVVKKKFDVDWYYIRRPGCTFCCRRRIIQMLSVLWYKEYAHDVLLWHLAIINDGLYLMDAPSIFFRRHESNATPPNTHNKTARLKYAQIALEETRRIILQFDNSRIFKEISEDKKLIIKAHFDFERHRTEYLMKRKIKDIIWLYFHKRYYFSSIKSWVQDIICAYK